jgi:hypothetical protein
MSTLKVALVFLPGGNGATIAGASFDSKVSSDIGKAFAAAAGHPDAHTATQYVHISESVDDWRKNDSPFN